MVVALKRGIIVRTEEEKAISIRGLALSYSYDNWYLFDDCNAYTEKDYKKKWAIKARDFGRLDIRQDVEKFYNNL